MPTERAALLVFGAEKKKAEPTLRVSGQKDGQANQQT